jgi:hypothetical protein
MDKEARRNFFHATDCLFCGLKDFIFVFRPRRYLTLSDVALGALIDKTVANIGWLNERPSP